MNSFLHVAGHLEALCVTSHTCDHQRDGSSARIKGSSGKIAAASEGARCCSLTGGLDLLSSTVGGEHTEGRSLGGESCHVRETCFSLYETEKLE